MKNSKTSNLVLNNVYLLIPLIIYGIYKNGLLIYQKGLINFIGIFKPLYLVLIGILVKFLIDLIKYKKIKLDYNLVYVILVGMIMPYNINVWIYIISFTILYILTLFIEKHIKFNKIAFIYLVIILINSIFNEFTFLSILEQKYSYSFDLIDLLMGRNVGGISSTSILFSLSAYIILINNFYYKKDIPLVINLTYLGLANIYWIISNSTDILINSELIFASIFVSALPEYSPYKNKAQIIYGVFVGILSFIITITFNSIISIYIALLIASLFQNINVNKKET